MIKVKEVFKEVYDKNVEKNLSSFQYRGLLSLKISFLYLRCSQFFLLTFPIKSFFLYLKLKLRVSGNTVAQW